MQEKSLPEFHNMSNTRTYKSWESMKTRCYNENCNRYKNYGGRGISVCNEWKNSFLQFLKDMEERPENKSLDRIDNNGNYEPSNCKWSTFKEQMSNRSPMKNKTGFTGVEKINNKFRARIWINKKLINLGIFESPEEAHNAYLLKKKEVKYDSRI